MTALYSIYHYHTLTNCCGAKLSEAIESLSIIHTFLGL